MSRRSLAAVIPSAFPTASCVTVHGGGRKPPRVDRRPLDRAAIAAWTAEQEIARGRYHRDSPAGRRRIRQVVTS